MPFKSKAQQKFMFSQHPKMAKRWAEHTPDIKALPEHVSKKEKAAFVRSFVNSFLSKVTMTAGVSQALAKLAAFNPGQPAIDALEEKEFNAKNMAADSTVAKGEQDMFKQKFLGHVATPAGLGMLGGYGLAKLFRPSDVEVDNLQKKELLTHYDSAIQELERRIAARHQ